MDRKIIALDVDGVLVDYVGAACAWCGREKEEATAWDFFGEWGMPGLWKAWDAVVAKKDFCYSLPILSGAIEFVSNLRGLGHRVVFATSPHKNAPLWPGERQLMLERWFNVNRDDVVMVHDKSLVLADLLIDDKPENLVAFYGHKILFSQTWNRRSDIGLRCNGYKETLAAVKGIFG